MSDALHPLSAVEVEALRQMRTRLAKAPASDAAAATLGRAFLQVAGRSGFGPAADPSGLAVVQATLGPDHKGLREALDGAGLATLGLYAAVLAGAGRSLRARVAAHAERRAAAVADLPPAPAGRARACGAAHVSVTARAPGAEPSPRPRRSTGRDAGRAARALCSPPARGRQVMASRREVLRAFAGAGGAGGFYLAARALA